MAAKRGPRRPLPTRPAGVGRPLLGRERRERFQVRLEPHLAGWLEQLGDGNRSAGIERAAKYAGYKPDPS